MTRKIILAIAISALISLADHLIRSPARPTCWIAIPIMHKEKP
jgi:hypothetical protein